MYLYTYEYIVFQLIFIAFFFKKKQGLYLLPNGRRVTTSLLSVYPQTFIVHKLIIRNKKPTRCHLGLYLFLLYNLLNMFRATLCPSSGADD